MVLRRCIEEGLVGGEGLAVDAGLIKADANWQNAIEGEKGLPPAEPFRSIWLCSTTLLSARRPRSRPKFISPADPAARWTGARGGQAFFAYSGNPNHIAVGSIVASGRM